MKAVYLSADEAAVLHQSLGQPLRLLATNDWSVSLAVGDRVIEILPEAAEIGEYQLVRPRVATDTSGEIARRRPLLREAGVIGSITVLTIAVAFAAGGRRLEMKEPRAGVPAEALVDMGIMIETSRNRLIAWTDGASEYVHVRWDAGPAFPSQAVDVTRRLQP